MSQSNTGLKMTDTKYNGWTNYATWRVNLEIFDGMGSDDLGCFTRYETPNPSDVADYLKDYVEEILCQDCDSSRLAHSYAMAFISEVNWYEIAQHFMDEWQELINEEQRENEDNHA
jgi:excinuclease UvrABC ATPase subunit